MNANVATQMITYFPLRWPVSIYMLLVFFFYSRFSEWKIQPISTIFCILNK